ncbi:hypothetical protein C9374_012416 [Naegleria lovaniensis]|uniref:Uncharacterized protein n=1 Tax=Naegleria lovaniensis TaxID=51637 RepID=A0AA88H1W2_NAELO|nr:uncharacterized protein C9374_012416 [Naegleria lovaniensis]KAG2392164.1 hypothetical protein C9374_012416 [Naegleria lovaniensis]
MIRAGVCTRTSEGSLFQLRFAYFWDFTAVRQNLIRKKLTTKTTMYPSRIVMLTLVVLVLMISGAHLCESEPITALKTVHPYSPNMNVSQGEIYALYYVQFLQLFKMNPFNARPSPVGPPVTKGDQILAQQQSDIDYKNQIFYTTTFNRTSNRVELLGLSLQSGLIVRRIDMLVDARTPLVGLGQLVIVDQNTGGVFVVGTTRQLQTQNKIVLLKVSPDFSQIVKLTEMTAFLASAGANGFDPVNHILWLDLYPTRSSPIDYLYAFDGTTGQLWTQVENRYHMQTMEFDPMTGLMIGLGLVNAANNTYTRALVTLDSVRFQLLTGAVIEGNYFMIQAPLGPINVVSRKMYCMMQVNGATINDPYDLLTIDLNHGRILHKVTLTPDVPIPWQMQVFNKRWE